MTDQQFPPPGPELDALVAEKVMGKEQYAEELTKEEAHWVYQLPAGVTTVYRFPKFSTSIEAAWEVVKQLESHGFHLVKTQIPKLGYMCVFDNLLVPHEWGETAPHAICLASLKAVGHNPADYTPACTGDNNERGDRR